MYLYQITNLINNKKYIGQTNNIQKRWSNHKCCNSPNMVIAKAIKKYGVDNFKFEVLYKDIPIDKIDDLERKIIQEKNTLVPNGYNVSKGGQLTHEMPQRYGVDNSNAHLTQEEAQYILDHRDQPMYILYDDFSELITYDQFRKLYHHQTYTNLKTTVAEYPYNFEFSNEFTSKNKIEYDEVVKKKKKYAAGVYWEDAYKDYKDIYPNKWGFWQIYTGIRFKLVMPEVFTKENKHFHSGLGKAGALNGRAKLTEEDVKDIRKMWDEGYDRPTIHKKYPQVSITAIRNVIQRKTWKNVL